MNDVRMLCVLPSVSIQVSGFRFLVSGFSSDAW